MNDLLRFYRPPFLEVIYQRYFSPSEIFKINLAYTFANIAHFGQKREDGTPYIYHPHRMVRTQIDILQIYDSELCLANILHDVDEQSWLFLINSNTVGTWFGLKHKHNITMLTKTSENKATYLVAIRDCGDWRIITAKLIDRIDNMETLDGLSVDFQKKQGEETRKYFFDLCKALKKVIPEEYRNVPQMIEKILDTQCKKYGC